MVLDFDPANGRICVLQVKNRFFNISMINSYASTEDKDGRIMDDFYETLERVYDRRPKDEVKIIFW